MDIIFASFMRKKEDVMEVRAAIEAAQNPRSPSSSPSASRKQGRRKRHGRSKKIMVISKIESPEGLRNFDEILAASDGIMVARGDLGMCCCHAVSCYPCYRVSGGSFHSHAVLHEFYS